MWVDIISSGLVPLDFRRSVPIVPVFLKIRGIFPLELDAYATPGLVGE